MHARTAEMDKLSSEHEVQVKSLQDRAKEQIDRLLKDKEEAAGNHEVQLAQAMRDQQERKEQLLQANALNEEMNEAIISSTDKIGSSVESLDKALLDALERIKATQESALQEAEQMKEEMKQLKEHQVTLKGEHISEMGEMQKKFKAQQEADEQRHIKALEQEYAKGKSEGAASERAQNEEKRKDHDQRMNDQQLARVGKRARDPDDEELSEAEAGAASSTDQILPAASGARTVVARPSRMTPGRKLHREWWDTDRAPLLEPPDDAEWLEASGMLHRFKVLKGAQTPAQDTNNDPKSLQQFIQWLAVDAPGNHKRRRDDQQGTIEYAVP